VSWLRCFKRCLLDGRQELTRTSRLDGGHGKAFGEPFGGESGKHQDRASRGF
jgi:hypothetical protein